jgi:hypothetical protein
MGGAAMGERAAARPQDSGNSHENLIVATTFWWLATGFW